MKRILLSVSLILSIAGIHAQDNQFKEPIPRTPNAASLGKYGDIPVSYHTGVPNISIPIYTIREGELSLPISLSYHSSGIKVKEVSSWVGLGWSLNSGGVISRTVIGGRDEGITNCNISGGYSNEAGWGWYKDYGILNKIENPGLCSSSDGNPNSTYPSGNTNCRSYFLDAANGLIDTEPDIYTYNFNGYSGKFFFDTNRTPHTIPKEDILIEPVNDEPTNVFFISWKLTTPDGVKYFFGGTGATENNYSYANGTGNITAQYNTATSWYLYRIESVNGTRWIELDYVSEDYSIGERTSHTYIVADCDWNCEYDGNEEEAPQPIMLNKVQGKRLSKITTSSGHVTVEFIASSSARQDISSFNSGTNDNTEGKYLAEIQIKDSVLNIVKEFELDIDYFQSSTSSGYPSNYTGNYDTKRLRLNSIQEKSGDGLTVKPAYEFTYNTTQMARRYSLAMDYWGYYNGATANHGLLPNNIDNPCRWTTNDIDGGAIRSVDDQDMKAWILEKIEYPSGGETHFNYEAHEYNGNDIGGLRIAQITKKFNNNQPDVILEYEYSDAKLFTKNPYTNLLNFFGQDPCSNMNYVDIGIVGCDHFGYTINGSPKTPAYATQSYLIGYGVVKEKHANGAYTQYDYKTLSDMPWGIFPEIPQQSPLGNGQLEGTYHKDINDACNSYSTSQYGTSTYKFVNAKKIVSATDYCCPPEYTCQLFDVTLALFNNYQISTVRDRVLSKVSYNDGITTNTTFSYDLIDKHGNPTEVEVTNSDNQDFVTEYTYPSDPGSGAPAQMYDPNNSNYKHMPGVLIQQTTKVGSNPVSKVLNNYTYDSGEDKIHPTSTVTYPSGSSEYKSVNYGFDEYDNIATIAKSDGMVNSYYWGYNHSLPVAKISNAEIDNTHDTIPDTRTVQTQYTNDITGWTNLGTPLILDHDQSLSININITQQGGSNAHCGVRLQKPDGTSYVFSGTYYPGDSYVNTLELPAGSYQYQFTMETGTSYIVFLTIETNYKYTNIENNIIYESFEDDENASTAYAKTGRKSNYGVYTLQIYADPGTYILSYWQKSNSSAPWVYHEIELVNPPTTYVIASSGQYTDEIRFFPKGAQMETYTHDPVVGVTSITDINNQTIHYEYDDFGRLVKITDPDGNLIQEVEYNYANQ